MKNFLPMTCLMIVSCTIVEIKASMENSRKSSRIVNLPPQNFMHNQIDSDDEILYLKLSSRNVLKQKLTMSKYQDVKDEVPYKKIKSPTISYLCCRSQEELNKIWNHPSVKELTLDKIEIKSLPPEDSPARKKSKKSQDVDDYSSDSYKADESFSDQDESALLENSILYENNQNSENSSSLNDSDSYKYLSYLYESEEDCFDEKINSLGAHTIKGSSDE